MKHVAVTEVLARSSEAGRRRGKGADTPRFPDSPPQHSAAKVPCLGAAPCLIPERPIPEWNGSANGPGTASLSACVSRQTAVAKGQRAQRCL
ncbi:hypothetical protein chiPu_0026836 [Chiloscyllium punctatum]|uniref:Uncharacterized protein n=1 Tax=Chiloscyllium punctatum TaxID=137246 RepID=A0A401TJB6_CHIPU|nr:hypothetical protein [Chiloscyllium punctatum]